MSAYLAKMISETASALMYAGSRNVLSSFVGDYDPEDFKIMDGGQTMMVSECGGLLIIGWNWKRKRRAGTGKAKEAAK